MRQRGQLVLRHARKLLRLINQLLDLSKLEAGALRLHPVAGEAGGFARQVAGAFQDLARQRGIALAVEAPGPELPLTFDPHKLEEILSNLLANALRFTPAGGRVTLHVGGLPATAAAPAGLVEFAVTDTGPGIAPEQLPHLFGRFYQAAHPRPTEGAALPHTGTGLGLALVRELAELHGGTASVASVVGEGSTFRVRLPRLETLPVPGAAYGTPSESVVGTSPSPTLALLLAETAAAPPLVGAPPPGVLPAAPPGPVGGEVADSEQSAPCVLIVEDNADVRGFIRDTLAPAGYHLLEAADAAAGLALARAEGPDLVVSDVMMPGDLDGFDLCARLKTDPATSHIAVVMLTARASLPDKLAGLETGADAYLSKPFHQRELRAQVASLLALRQHQQQRLAATLAPVKPVETGQPAASEAVRTSVPPSPLAVHLAAVAALPSLDQQFLTRAHEAVAAHLDDEKFSVEDLSAALHLSRAQAHRKLKILTGQSPGEFVRTARLLRAHALLQGRVGTVAEVAYRVGFASPAHFSTAFSRHFGCSPSEVAKGMAA